MLLLGITSKIQLTSLVAIWLYKQFVIRHKSNLPENCSYPNILPKSKLCTSNLAGVYNG